MSLEATFVEDTEESAACICNGGVEAAVSSKIGLVHHVLLVVVVCTVKVATEDSGVTTLARVRADGEHGTLGAHSGAEVETGCVGAC